MKSNTYHKPINLFSILLITLFLGGWSSSSQDILQSEFIKPQEDNNVWCYWYWINDDISKEGITKDLEAMKDAGIGAALIGNINPAKKTEKYQC